MYRIILEYEKEGITQGDVWKLLKLTSREGSRIALRLEKRGLIRRAKVVRGGRWTYLLLPLVRPARLASVEGAPCLTCPYEPRCRPGAEVNPANCPPDLEQRGIAAWALAGLQKARKPRGRA